MSVWIPSLTTRMGCLAGLLLAGALGGSAEPAAPPGSWATRVWQVDDGLPDNRVTGVAQTPDGYLWVATRGGLVRFNGSGFEKFDLSTLGGVNGNGARAMYADKSGDLWVGGYREEAIRISSNSAQVMTSADGVPNGQFVGFAGDGNGNNWLAFGGHICRVVGAHLEEVAMPEGTEGAGRASLATDAKGVIWGSHNGSVGVLAAGGFVSRYQLEGRDVFLASAKRGGLWASADSHLFRLKEGESPVAWADLPAGVRVISLLEDQTGALWAGTQTNGLFRCDGRSVRSVQTSHQQISSLIEDREGNIWVGTFGGGLNRIRPRAVELIGPRSGLPFEAVVSVSEDSAGQFWVAGGNGQLAHGDNGHWMIVPEGGGTAACVAEDRQGRLWVGTRGQGLREIHPQDGSVRVWRVDGGTGSNGVRCVFVGADDSLWFATNAPARFGRIAGGTMRTWPMPAATRNVRAIVEDARGAVWVGTSDGQVLKFTGEEFVREPAMAEEVSHSVRSLHATPDGRLWIGYADWGIGLLKDGHYVRLTAGMGLAGNTVCQISSDHEGSLWLAAAHGLSRLTLDNATAVADGRADKLQPARYGQGEALPNAQPHYDNSPAVCQSRDGRVLIATTLGLLVVNPGNLRDNQVPPPVIVERVMTDDRMVALAGSRFPLRGSTTTGMVELNSGRPILSVAPEHHRLAFEFAALSYTAPENVRYRYRLEGFDDAWIDAGRERVAQYSHLPAGNYTFRVIASNDVGVWNETGATVGIIVTPFYWQTWWFRLGLGGIFTAAVIVVVRRSSFRRLSQKLQQAEQTSALYEERARIARDIHDELGGSLATIKLRSELALQDRTSPTPGDEHLQKITGTAQAMLHSLDEIVWAINPSNDTLAHVISYLGQYAVEFLGTAGIRCIVDLPENPPEVVVRSSVRHHLMLSVKEALTNVVRHSRARTVRFTATFADGHLQVVVDDDGCGLVATPGRAEGDGLQNMRQRMASAGGSFEVRPKSGPGAQLVFSVAIHPPA